MYGALLFTVQIYCDFSGYSHIAIGTAKLFGINLMQNFNYPYFSRDISEFWRKWHISLTTWFRDYLYIPMGGSRCGKLKGFRNTVVIFVVSGLWHGASWNYILWGAYHAFLFLPLFLWNRNRKYLDMVASGRILPNMREMMQMTLTFVLVMFGLIIFRAENKELLCRIAELANSRSASLVLVSTPLTKVYYENMDSIQYQLMLSVASDMVADYDNVIYLNMIEDSRFSNSDFRDVDHLNARGAEKLSKIISDTLLVLNNRKELH